MTVLTTFSPTLVAPIPAPIMNPIGLKPLATKPTTPPTNALKNPIMKYPCSLCLF